MQNSKMVMIVVAVIVIVAGGTFALVKHNDNKNKSTASTAYTNGTTGVGKTTPTTTPTPSASTASSVTISNFAFSSANITVKKGTAVTWTNKDAVAHTVVETDGQDGPKSQDLNQGQSYSFTYNTAGTFKYHCSIHAQMTGTVTVTD
jgi:plastocyanin